MNLKTMSDEQLNELLEKREKRIGDDQEVVNSIEGELLRRRLHSMNKVDEELIRDLLCNGYSDLPGDAGKSRSEWFRCLRRDAFGIGQFVIVCPEFLRNSLRIQVRFQDGEVRSSCSY